MLEFLLFINLLILDYLTFKIYRRKEKLVGTLNLRDLDEDFCQDNY